MARVSIGLPVYNGENFVAESIQSILDQTYRDFELIISDNASTDRTQDICVELASRDPRIRYHRQARNLGCALNSNFVFHQAKGEYFKWISHDDLHAPQFVEKCVEVLDRDPDAVMCCPRGILIDETGREIRMYSKAGRNLYQTASGEELEIRAYDPPKRLDVPEPHRRFRDMVLRTSWSLEIYGLVRTDVLRQTSLHGSYHGTDKRILAELALLGRIVAIDEPMLFYRQHPAQALRYRGSAVARDAYLSGGMKWSWTRFPGVSNLLGYSGAVGRSQLSAWQRAVCYGAIAQWLIQPAKWRGFVREAAQVAASTVRPGVQATGNGTGVSS